MDASMQRVAEHFKHDQFAAMCGLELVELRPGYAKARLIVEPRHYNSLGIVQGGVLFTLADFAFAAASNSSGRAAVGLQMSLSCLRPTVDGELIAVAEEVTRSRKVSTCSVRIFNDRDEPVALFHGTAYVKSEAFPPTDDVEVAKG